MKYPILSFLVLFFCITVVGQALNFLPIDTCLVNSNQCQYLQTFAAQLIPVATCEAARFNWSIGVNNRIIAEGEGSSFEYTVEVGTTYQVEFSATDTCDNETTSQQSFTFTDCQAPIIEVKQGKQFLLDYLGAKVYVYPSDLVITASDNCSLEEELIFKITLEETTNLSKEAILLLAESINFTLTDIGSHLAYIYALDAAGNVTTERVVIILEANFDCQSSADRHRVAGIIQVTTGEGIEDVTVSFVGGGMESENTNSAGNYVHILSKGSYEIIPSKEDDPMNGVTTFDQVLIQRHLLDIQPFNTFYEYVAADINLSGSISTFDIVLLRSMILGKKLPFTAQESWIFIPTSYAFPEEYTINYPINQPINTSLGITSDFNFVGVKRGDINENAIINSNFRPTTSSNKELLELTTTDIWLEANQTYTVPFTFSTNQSLSGFQLTFSAENASLLALNQQPTESGLLGMQENLCWYVTTDQDLRLNWTSVEPTTAVQFEITLRPEEDGYLSQQLQLNQRSFTNEAYTDELVVLSIGLSYQSPVTEEKKIVAFLQPNLLTSSTTQLIIQGLPTTTLFIRILNAQGQLIQEYQNQTTVDYYQQTLRLPDASGIYWVQLQTVGGVSEILKAVKI